MDLRVAAAVGQLSAEAASDRTALHNLQMMMITERRTLAVFGLRRYGPDDDSSHDGESGGGRPDGLVTVAVLSSRRAFVIGVASDLNVPGLKRAVKAISHRMDEPVTSSIRDLDNGFNPTGAVHRVIVYGGPYHLPVPTRRRLVDTPDHLKKK